MRGIPTSQIRAPLFSRVALASSLPTGALVIAYFAATEARGFPRYALVSVALLVAVVGIRWAWKVTTQETERLR